MLVFSLLTLYLDNLDLAVCNLELLLEVSSNMDCKNWIDRMAKLGATSQTVKANACYLMTSGCNGLSVVKPYISKLRKVSHTMTLVS